MNEDIRNQLALRRRGRRYAELLAQSRARMNLWRDAVGGFRALSAGCRTRANLLRPTHPQQATQWLCVANRASGRARQCLKQLRAQVRDVEFLLYGQRKTKA